MSGIDPHGLGEELDRPIVLTPLPGQQAEPVQGIHVTRLGRQDRLVDLGRPGQPSRLVVRQPLLECGACILETGLAVQNVSVAPCGLGTSVFSHLAPHELSLGCHWKAARNGRSGTG